MSVIQFPTSEPRSPTKPDHVELAEYLSPDGNLIYSQSQFWAYDPAGVWRVYHDEKVKRDLQMVFRELHVEAKASDVNGAMSMAKGVYFLDVAWDQTDPRAICASNGVLQYRDGEWHLAPYKREDYRRIRLAVQYDQKATCPRFQKYLGEVFHGCTDAQERARALLEFIGLSLTASTEFERAILLLGNGAAGKSKAVNLISAMVGPEHRAAVALSQLDNRFQLAHLDAKLINVMSETSEGGDLPDAQIKQLISGELMTAEHKLKPPFSFRPMAKFWLATNHLPSTRDFSEGVAPRHFKWVT